MSYLRYLSLLAHSGVHQLLCSVFCFVFLRLVYLMLPISLDCPFFANVYIMNIFFLLLNKIADSFLTIFSNIVKRIFKAKMFQFISGPLHIIKYVNGMRI